MDPQVYYEVICDWALNQMLFQWISIMRIPNHDKIKYINGYEHSECHGLPVLC